MALGSIRSQLFVVRSMRKLVFICSMSLLAPLSSANEFGASIGRTMTMNSAICNQTKTCPQRTPEQEKEFKAIGADALACITAARKQFKGNDHALDQAVKQCKSERDARYADLKSRTKHG
jgi:hypothetical protein